jgi:predicted MFS family arabinose efflux permease
MMKSSSSRAWLAVAAVALASFILITTEFLPIGFLQRLGLAFHLKQGMVGLMVTVPGIVAAFAAPLSTLLVGRMDRRFVLGASLVFVALSNTVVALAGTFTLVLIGRAFLGIAVGVFWSFCIAVARRLVPGHSGHRATAVVLAGVSVGTVVGVPIGSILAMYAGWRFAFGSAAAASFISLLVLCLLLPRIPGTQSQSVSGFASLFRIKPLVIGYVTMALSAAGHFAAYTYLQPLLLERANFGTSGVSWTLFGYGVAGAVGTFVGERVTQFHLKRAFFFVVLALAAGILLSSFISNSVLILALVVMWGAAFGAVPVCTQLWIFEAAPQQFEAASAVGMTVFQTALALGSLSGGMAFDHYGLTSAFRLGGALLVICAAIIAAPSSSIPSKCS